MPRRPFVSTIDDKVAWLIAHADRWEDLPADLISANQDVRAALVAIGEAMVQAGLYSTETGEVDRSISIVGHIQRIRKRQHP